MNKDTSQTRANRFLRILDRLTRRIESIADAAHATSEDDKTRLQYYTIFLLLGLPTMAIYGFYGFINADYLLVGIIAITASCLLCGWYLLRKMADGRIIYRINSLIFAALILYMFQTGGQDGSKILWMYVYPLIVFFLFGKTEGFFWSATVLVMAVVIFWMPLPIISAYVYSGELKARFITTYCIVTMITFWFEHTRHHFRIDKTVFKKRVDERTAELMQVNQRLHQTIEQANQLAEKAEAANKAKSDFLATMSHEIRTPMNSILGLSHLALENDRLDDQTQDYLKGVHTSALSLLGIIDDILDFSKIEAHKLFLEEMNFNLEEVLGNVANMLGGKAVEKNLELLFFYDSDIPIHLRGDPLRLGQIFINLVSNAIKFTEEGEVVLSIKVLGQRKDSVHLEFKVRDTGIGLTQDQIDLLFEPFSQADSSTTRRFGGSGLGLAICSRLAKLMGGQINAESRNAQGSTFTFSGYFGLSPTRDLNAYQAFHKSFTGKRVLVVDGHSTGRAVVRYMLRSLGFDVTTVSSMEEAASQWAALVQQNAFPVLMVLDCSVLDAESAGFVLDLKNTHPIPIILMVPQVENTMGKEFLEQMDKILVKPVLFSSFTSGIVECLGTPIKKSLTIGMGEPEEALSLEDFEGLKVLIVEDKEINQKIVSDLLRKKGCHITVAENGREALAKLDQAPIDMVLMDIQMPEMDGLEATRAIRADGRFHDLPIIAMTAHAIAGDREKCFQAGMSDYLSKPIIPNQLYTMMSGWIPVDQEMAAEQPNNGTSDGSDIDFAQHLPHFDVIGALNESAGNSQRYRKMLLEFRAYHSDTIPALRNLLQTSDLDGARLKVHSLLGTCSKLGADHIVLVLEALESKLKDAPTEDVTPLIEALEKMLDQSFDAIGKLAEMSAADQASNTGYIENRDELMEAIKQLEMLLDQGRLDAADQFAEFKKMVPSAYRKNEYFVLADAVQRLDYSNARKALNNLSNSLLNGLMPDRMS